MGDIAGGTYVEDEKQRQKNLQNLASGATTSLSGSGTGILNISGSNEARAGGLEGLQMGQLLYGQGMADVGKEAADYSGAVKGRLGQDSVNADAYRQQANQRLAQQAAKSGLGGTNQFGAQEQLYRQSGMQAAAMNQEYKDKALALYGRNIGAKQAGLAGLYQAGKGQGVAGTPGQIPSLTGGISVICTELHRQGKISTHEWVRASAFGYKVHPNIYFGYLTIARPIVHFMKKSDKFSNIFIGWSKSIAKQKPNLLTRLMMPICFMVGYVRQIKKEKIA